MDCRFCGVQESLCMEIPATPWTPCCQPICPHQHCEDKGMWSNYGETMKGIIKCSDGQWIFSCARSQQVGDTTSEGQIELRSWWECRRLFQTREGPAPHIGDQLCEPQHAICFDFKNTYKLVSLFQLIPIRMDFCSIKAGL